MSVRAEIGFAVLLAAGITVAVVAGVKTGAPTPEFEPASTFASGPGGSRALYDVLQGLGVKVERRRAAFFDLNTGGHRRPGLLVMIEPELGLASAEQAQLAKFVRAGGALFLAGRSGGIGPCLGWARQLLPDFSHPDTFAVEPVAGRKLPGVVTFLQPWRDSLSPGERNACPRFGPATLDTVVRTRSGRPVLLDFRFRDGGRILFAGDDGWMRNAAWRNTAVPYLLVPLMEQRAGEGPVVFDEYHHGFAASGTTGLVVRWLMGTPAGWALLQLVAAGLIWLGVSAVRFGPARAVIDRRRRSPLEHLDALAAGLESSKGYQTALGLIVGGLRRRLSRTAQGPVATKADEQWIAALTLAMPTAPGRGAVRRLREAFTQPGGGERVLAAANSVEDVWEELRPRATRDAFSKP